MSETFRHARLDDVMNHRESVENSIYAGTMMALVWLTKLWNPGSFPLCEKILEISVGSQMEYSWPLLEVVHFGLSVGQVGAKIAVPFWQTGWLPFLSSVDFTSWWIRERNRKWQRSFLLVGGPVWSENVVPFSSVVSPAGLCRTGLTYWKVPHFCINRNHVTKARGVGECDICLFVFFFIQHFPRVLEYTR